MSTTPSDSERPFFVVGSDRSGTTMLRLMLNVHSRLVIPNESWFLIPLLDEFSGGGETLSGEARDRAFNLITEHWRWQEWGLDKDELWSAFEGIDEPTLTALVHAVFQQVAEAAGKPRWGDKTPGYVVHLRSLHQLMPEAQFIHLIRDGRDVCLSLKKTGWRGQTTWDIARYWAAHVGEGCEQGRALPPGTYLEVAYEALVSRTEDTLRSICDFLGEAYEPDMLRFYETAGDHLPDRDQSHLEKTYRAPSHADLARWKDTMSYPQIAIFEAFAGEVMEDVGQRRHIRSRIPGLRAFCLLLDALARWSLPLRRRLGIHFPKLSRRL